MGRHPHGGYLNNIGWIKLDASYKANCQFDIYIGLIRATMASSTYAADAARQVNAPTRIPAFEPGG